MSVEEAIAYVLGVLFAAGGPIVVWINARARNKEELTTKELQTEAAVAVVEEAGLDERWMRYASEMRDYAVDLEKRLNERVDDLEERWGRSRRRNDQLLSYAEELRTHIQQDKGPPPPPWPDDL